MNIITGCLGTAEGEVLVDGHSVSEEPLLAKKQIGYLPEQPPLYMDMTPAEYLRFVASAKGIPQREQSGQIDRMMDKTGIREVRNRLIRNLRRFSKMRRFLVSTQKMRLFASIHKFHWFVSKLAGFFQTSLSGGRFHPVSSPRLLRRRGRRGNSPGCPTARQGTSARLPDSDKC